MSDIEINQPEIVDCLIKISFERGEITKSLEIKSKIYKAYENKLIDSRTFELIHSIIHEE